MDEPTSRLARLNQRIKHHPVVITLLMLGSLVIALAAFTDASRNLLDLFAAPQRADINGHWQARIHYLWLHEPIDERFCFVGEDTVLTGSASFVGADYLIVEGHVERQQLRFMLRSRQLHVDQPLLHHYQGRLVDADIHFVLHTEGSTDPPIRFTASRAP